MNRFSRALLEEPLSAGNLESWMKGWSDLAECLNELYARLYAAVTMNTVDKQANQRLDRYLDEVFPPSMQAEQSLKEKLLASGLQPKGFEIPLKKMQVDAEIFRAENLPLLAEDEKMGHEYDRITGAQTIIWEGKELTLPQVQPIYQSTDRPQREDAWRAASARALNDRETINALWQKMMALRIRTAANAGFSSYNDYRWKALRRFDYTPQDCRAFHAAIEEVVVPVSNRLYEHRRQRMGLDSLRPWDLNVDPLGRAPLHPFSVIEELTSKASSIFHNLDPVLGGYFDTMDREGLLDLENRKNKAPGGYCNAFARVHKPFIFMNAVGIHDDVQTILHESGHSFHVFESAGLPYFHQTDVPAEFAEVASMGMELLTAPYLAAERGGYYSKKDAARARAEHLESAILFWPYMAVVDAFQLWAYDNASDAADPAKCDKTWGDLWNRFMPGVDWGGLEDEMVTGWQRKLHIFTFPLYYVEYGMAQLGAVQVWLNAQKNQAEALAAYRRSLALGGSVSLPEMFAAAGGRFGFDAGLLRTCVSAMENAILQLDQE